MKKGRKKLTNGMRKRLCLCVKAIFAKLSADSVFAYAGQACYFMSVSSLPLAMLVLSLLRYLLPVTQEQILFFAELYLPEKFDAFVLGISEELFAKSNDTLIPITALALLCASTRGIRALCDGVRNVYGTRLSVSYPKKYLLSFFYTVVFIVLILSAVALMVFGDYLVGILEEVLSVQNLLLWIILALRGLIFLVLLTVVFGGMFNALGKKSSTFCSHLPGAVFASVGWVLFSRVFAVYVNHFPENSYLYGSLTALILLMLWLYMCMTILLLGAEINCFLREYKTDFLS